VRCCQRLTVNIRFVISRNECNKFVSSSVMQQQVQHRIRGDLSNSMVGPKKLLQMHGVMWFTPCVHVLGTWITWCHVPREHDAAVTKPDVVYFIFAHHMTRIGPLMIACFRLWYNNVSQILDGLEEADGIISCLVTWHVL